MPYRQRSVGEQDIRKVMLGQHSWSDGASTIKIAKAVKCLCVERAVLRLAQTVGVVNSILQVDVGIDMGGPRRGRIEVVNRRFGGVKVRREGGRYGVGRCRQHALLLLLFGGRIGGNSSEAVATSLSDPVARLRYVNRGRFASKGRADGRIVLGSHIEGRDCLSVGSHRCESAALRG